MAAQDPTVSKESNGSAMVVTAYVMLALSWISVGLRTYVRGFLTKGFMADDWWMLAAQVCRPQKAQVPSLDNKAGQQLNKLPVILT